PEVGATVESVGTSHHGQHGIVAEFAQDFLHDSGGVAVGFGKSCRFDFGLVQGGVDIKGKFAAHGGGGAARFFAALGEGANPLHDRVKLRGGREGGGFVSHRAHNDRHLVKLPGQLGKNVFRGFAAGSDSRKSAQHCEDPAEMGGL